MRRLYLTLCAIALGGCFINLEADLPADNPALPALCSNDLLDEGEGDVDCGFACSPCADGQTCNGDADCRGNSCVAGVCFPQHCVNGTFDLAETDIDCGGGCLGCDLNQACLVPDDCLSGFCTVSDLICVATSCEDGAMSGDESDIDCGGACAAGCLVGDGCYGPSDCVSDYCHAVDGQCVATSCEDATISSDETDVDCGGSCPGCAVGELCTVPGDCASGLCYSESGVDTRCIATSCDDNSLSGDETDVNCGGPDCVGCEVGKICDVPGDCASTYCNIVTHECVATSCEDTLLNGDESALNCGGSCAGCLPGVTCDGPGDCASQRCDVDVCTAVTCASGAQEGDETGVDCGGSCPPCRGGQGCVSDDDCEGTRVCVGAPTGTCECLACPTGTALLTGTCVCIDQYELSAWDTPTCDGTGSQYGAGFDNYDDVGFLQTVASNGMVGVQVFGGADHYLVEPEQNLYACSLPGVLPSSFLSWFQAKRLCESSGKRLCEPEEWLVGCDGGTGDYFPYGDTYVEDHCNCATGTTAPDGCGTNASCASNHHAAPIYDLSGNVTEWVNYCESRNCDVRGGSFQSQYDYMARCSSDSTAAAASELTIRLHTGGRCCQDF